MTAVQFDNVSIIFGSNPQKALEMAEKMKSNSFTLDDFLDQMEQMKNLGSMEDLVKMIPGMDAGKLAGAQIDEKQMARTKAIIQSMTRAERHDPDILTASRRKRIARGSGTSVQEVNRLMNQFNSSKQLMKQMSGRMKKGKRGGFPFGF